MSQEHQVCLEMTEDVWLTGPVRWTMGAVAIVITFSSRVSGDPREANDCTVFSGGKSPMSF